jgi:hypothetical protein
MTTSEKGRKLVTGASEEMITSAHRTLPTKSTLGAEVARVIEKEFGERMQALVGEGQTSQPAVEPTAWAETPRPDGAAVTALA